MKKILELSLVLLIILTGFPSCAESRLNKSVTPIDFSRRSVEDFEFTGQYAGMWLYGGESYKWEITDGDVQNLVFDYICSAQENRADRYINNRRGRAEAGEELILTDRTTGEIITVGYGIFYENLYVNGGPGVVVIKGEGWHEWYLPPANRNLDAMIKVGVFHTAEYSYNRVKGFGGRGSRGISDFAMDILRRQENCLYKGGYADHSRDRVSVSFMMTEEADKETVYSLLTDEVKIKAAGNGINIRRVNIAVSTKDGMKTVYESG